MGYSDVDKLAINTIRLLAVSAKLFRPLSLALHRTLLRPPRPCLSTPPSWPKAPHFTSPSLRNRNPLSASITATDSCCIPGRCYLQVEFGTSGCPYVSALGKWLQILRLTRLLQGHGTRRPRSVQQDPKIQPKELQMGQQRQIRPLVSLLCTACQCSLPFRPSDHRRPAPLLDIGGGFSIITL